MNIWIFAFFLVLVSTLIESLPTKPKFNRNRLIINGRPWHGLKPAGNLKESKKASDVQWFYQKLDHFNASNNDFWWQRYWYNSDYYKPGGPAFIMIGGESTETAWWVQDDTIQWLKWAKEHGAIAFLLEHRFYGDSQPKSDMSTQTLRYLSSEQAIEDVVYFVQQSTQKFNLTSPKWIAFGGSYSGALAAWTRMRHPDVVYGAVASSAPVQPVVDFQGYLEVIADGLNNYNSACGQSLSNGMIETYNLLKTAAGRQKLWKGFQLCTFIDSADRDQVSYFFLQLIGLYMTVVQYSGDNVQNYDKNVNIPCICAYHLQANKTDLEKLQDVNAFFLGFYQESCLYINYEDYIGYLQEANDDRAWVYQTCNEFGYYQSTDSQKARAFYGDVLPLDWYIRQCELIYGFEFSNASIYQNVDKTNSVYHGVKGYNGTRVALPNGSQDPWHLPAILKSPNSESYAIFIQGTSHVADIYPDADNDPPALRQARQEIAQHLNDWLA